MAGLSLQPGESSLRCLDLPPTSLEKRPKTPIKKYQRKRTPTPICDQLKNTNAPIRRFLWYFLIQCSLCMYSCMGASFPARYVWERASQSEKTWTHICIYIYICIVAWERASQRDKCGSELPCVYIYIYIYIYI
jgi:hypothetical protein